MIRHTVEFSGRVQGVGFRYTTVNVARQHPVAGYVQNLPDGRVRLVAEGEPAQVTAFVESVREAMSGYIRSATIDASPATGEFGQPAPGALQVKY